MRLTRFTLDQDVDHTMILCAMRFDGYRWLETTQGRGANDFTPWTEPVARTMCLHLTDTENFAAYFALQRWLFKWGGEMQAPSAADHTAFRFLFLHLHHLPTPPEFLNPEYGRQWTNLDRQIIVAHAARVRHALLDRVLAKKITNNDEAR